MKKVILLILTLFLIPGLANAWWNDDWSYRKKLTIDTKPTGANIMGALNEYPVLVRLHGGNFKYFLDAKPDASDFRFIADDDKTPLKFHIEKFDPLSEIALIWLKIPVITANTDKNNVWLYYGNASAVTAQDTAGTYDANHVAVYHFDTEEKVLQDATAYGNNITQSGAKYTPASIIGGGLQFSDEASIVLNPTLISSLDTTTGFTISFWLRIKFASTDDVFYAMGNDEQSILIGHDASGLYVRAEKSGTTHAEMRAPPLSINTWQHIALTVNPQGLALYLDGQKISNTPAFLEKFTGKAMLGSDLDGARTPTADFDELQLSKVVRSPDWLSAMVSSQGQAGKMLIYGEDESNASSGGTSYFGVIMKNVTVDGWVVIVILIVMMAISWVVMLMKALFVRRSHNDNMSFLDAFRKLGNGDPAMLDAEETEEDKQLEASPIAAAMFGKHDHFQSSPIYHLYHRGIQEVHNRIGKAAGAQINLVLKKQSLDAIRASIDAVYIRESQKLNRLMVLLTIAISGGPFLGLLGTVIGVMITFAAIAASGDVNINAIAPGIAAALLATVAGLAVAIPALFGYNYIGSRIKEIQADMNVFVDEFITRLGEYYAK